MAARGLGVKINDMLEQQVKISQLRSFLKGFTPMRVTHVAMRNLDSLSDEEILELARKI